MPRAIGRRAVTRTDGCSVTAMQLGQLETVGLGWQLADEYVEHLSKVTPEQVREVARKYLVPENLTVAELDPQPLDGKQLRPAESGGHDHVR